MNRLICQTAAGFFSAVILSGCASTLKIKGDPITIQPGLTYKNATLSEEQKMNWSHMDLATDTVPGMSVNRAYKELIRKKKGENVIVAVLDSGIDLEHEDLNDVLWSNAKEAVDGKDSDGNGFIDDIHGYNFLGDAYHEQMEFARILRLGIGDSELQAEAESKLISETAKANETSQQLEQFLAILKTSDAVIKKELGKDNYTEEDLLKLASNKREMQQPAGILLQVLGFNDDVPGAIEEISKGIEYFNQRLKFHLNTEFDGREVVGDDPYDITDIGYGNGNPKNLSDDESHGTHVAGIIAANRKNKVGVKGVANNVSIMSIRAVPDGDEYDKDIALGIRYAVDNGAKIINGSFGKSFSPKAQWVYEALTYAAAKDVLVVFASGNEGEDLDDNSNPNFPNDHQLKNEPEFVDNVITVGSLNFEYGPGMVATSSNYGAINVDIFAPGMEIYSTMPSNKYEFQSGTSMAAPGVAGIAALIRSYYPSLTAPQVKKIIMQSGLDMDLEIITDPNSNNSTKFVELSRSGKIANAYNALILADRVASGKVNLN